VTLQLRQPNGTYGGAIVVATQQRGRRAVVGVKAGAKLGRVLVKPGRGYAKLARNLRARWVDRGRWARARAGVPIGNGRNFGFVRSKPPRGAPPGDADADGVSDRLDIDEDGDRVLNDFDRRASLAGLARGVADARQQQIVPTKVFGNPLLDLDLWDTVNANIGSLSTPDIEAALPKFGALTLGVTGIAADTGTEVELDCGDPDTGLRYCRKNGSSGTLAGRRFGLPLPPGGSHGAAYPSCCDGDGDGFGSLTHVVPPGGVPIYTVPLQHHTSDVGTGDVVTVRATIGGAPQQFSSTVQFVFQTVPAIVSYSDGQGNGATISYPVAPPDPQTGMGSGPGTRGNPLPVRAGSDGRVLVTLTFWKPQRPALAGESGSWIDLGRTVYGANISDIGLVCPGESYVEHPGLSLARFPWRLEPSLLDESADQSANPATTLRFTLDLTRCLATRGLSFNVGDRRGVDIEAIPAGAVPGGRPPTAVTHIWFSRQ
jgi:hypothetical protein